MAGTSDKYADYVEHPRYGRGPRYTVLNPDLEEAERPPLTYDGRRIPQTEILADTELQASSAPGATYYCDIELLCRDCGRPFIFFAEEQKYWYETLGISVGAVCVRCTDCRKERQQIARLRSRYQQLCRRTDRTGGETLEMAECCLTLIEKKIFTPKKLSRVRELLNSLPAEADPELQVPSRLLLERVRALET